MARFPAVCSCVLPCVLPSVGVAQAFDPARPPRRLARAAPKRLPCVAQPRKDISSVFRTEATALSLGVPLILFFLLLFLLLLSLLLLP